MRLLVQQVLTETASPGGGVRIILDLFPEKPFTYWKQSRPGTQRADPVHLGIKARSQGSPGSGQGRGARRAGARPHAAPQRGTPGERDGAGAACTQGGRGRLPGAQKQRGPREFRRTPPPDAHRPPGCCKAWKPMAGPCPSPTGMTGRAGASAAILSSPTTSTRSWW